MARKYLAELDDLPRVRLPDWELLGRIEDLLSPYLRLKSDPRPVYEAEDSRGIYDVETIKALRKEVEAQEEPPKAITVQLETPHHYVQVRMRKIGTFGAV
jgi:hypothetical protein